MEASPLLVQPDPSDPRLTRRVSGVDHTGAAVEASVTGERPLTLFLNGQEIVTISRASWDQNRLVINESTTYPDGRARKQRSILSLDAEGQLVIEIEEMIDDKPSRKLPMVMKRR